MKKITALVLALVLVLAMGTLSVLADGYETGTYVISVGDPDPNECFLNVRAGLPGEEAYSTILGQVWDGDRVEVLEVVNTDWGKIELNGQTGYIRLKNYTTFVPSEAPSENPSETPSEVPSEVPSETPSEVPSETPSEAPSETPVEPGKPGDAGVVTFVVLAVLSLAAVAVVKKARA